MKVIQLPFCYHPDPVGGTEIYVEALARGLNARGTGVVIAAPGRTSAGYDHLGIRVRRFQVSEAIADPSELYGEGDSAGRLEFEHILDEETPDLVHLHAFTRGVSLRLVRVAKRRGLPVLLTYHTPTVTCLRGTLLRWGSEICAGEMDRSPCAACALHGLGLGRVAAKILSGVPSSLGAWLGRRGLKGGFWTAARMSEFVRLRHECAHSLFAEVDHVVAVCQWVKELLRCNGVPSERITLSRQGLPYERSRAANRGPRSEAAGSQRAAATGLSSRPVEAPANLDLAPSASQPPDAPPPEPGRPRRIVFLGRLDPSKGPDVLIRALRCAPELNVTLDLYGMAQGPGGAECERQLRALAGGDARIFFRAPIPAADVVPLLQDYDLLAVPSQLLESGPLVVLEAFGAGVPVLGSNLGGIAELVQDGVNGLLVEAGNVDAWAGALKRLDTDLELIPRLRRGIRAPRTMATVADEMLRLYGALCRSAEVRTDRVGSAWP